MARRPSGSPRPLCAAGSMRQQPERATSSTAWRVRRGAGALHRTEEVRRRLDHHHVALLVEALLVGVEAAVELRELRVAAEGVRIDACGACVALALDLLRVA